MIDMPTDDADTLVHPAANPTENALLQWAKANAVDRPLPPISRGRYAIPDPDTGKPGTWMRMSSLAKLLFDDTAIVKWEKGNVVRGLRADPELLELPDDNDVARIAGKRGGDYLKADLGTAMHTGVERHALGLSNAKIPAPYDADLAAIIEALDRHGITFDPEWIEAAVLYPEVGAAGRLDGGVHGPWGDLLRIADVKTGRLDFGVGPWAAQLAGYARAPYRWTPDGLVEAPLRDTHTGIIIHAPLGTGTCHIYEIDLDGGHEILTHAYESLRFRGKHDKWLVPHTAPRVSEIPNSSPDEPVHVAEPITEVVGDLEARTDTWLHGRIAALADQPEAVKAVRLAWPTDTPGKPPWTAEQRTLVEAAISAGEKEVRAPFPAPKPTDDPPATLYAPAEDNAPTLRPRTESDDEATVDATVCAALAQSVKAMDVTRTTRFRDWLIEAQRAGRALGTMAEGKRWSARTHALIVAMAACLEHLWDDDDPNALVRAALAVALGDDEVQPTFSTGGLLGTLSADEARRLTQIAVAFGRSEPDTCAALGMAVAS